MRKLVLAAALLPAVAFAQQWEYQMIHLPPTVEMSGMTPKPKPGALIKQDGGYHVNTESTAILNKLAAEGWELIGVTGLGGGSHAVFLRRPKD